MGRGADRPFEGGGGGACQDRCWGGGADRPLEGGGGMTDRWSPALEKRAARRRVRLSEKARGAAARPAL